MEERWGIGECGGYCCSVRSRVNVSEKEKESCAWMSFLAKERGEGGACATPRGLEGATRGIPHGNQERTKEVWGQGISCVMIEAELDSMQQQGHWARECPNRGQNGRDRVQKGVVTVVLPEVHLSAGEPQVAVQSGGDPGIDAEGFIPVRSHSTGWRSDIVRKEAEVGSKEANRFSILPVEEDGEVAMQDGNSVNSSEKGSKAERPNLPKLLNQGKGKGKARDEEEKSSWSKAVVRSALRKLEEQQKTLVVSKQTEDEETDAMEDGEMLASSSRDPGAKENVEPVGGLLENQQTPEIELANPFVSQFRVIQDTEHYVGLGKEVKFKGEFLNKLHSGRGPKQKGGRGGRRPQVETGDGSKGADKLRVLGYFGPNGCRLATRENSQDTEDDDRRDAARRRFVSEEIGPLSLFQIIDKVLVSHRKHPGPFILLAKYSRICWLESNEAVYDQARGYVHSKVVLENARIEATAVTSKMRVDRGRTAQQRDEEFFMMANRMLALQTSRRRSMGVLLQEVMEVSESDRERSGTSSSEEES
ncbi:hypothetical protein R1sor_017523 [Riccia sorocarpa]|uniref:Uncharacterized protein n=1 Tax=Riccia sorocarpa TaxID=122646 RepID=A0ABD3I7G1_9MARC